MDPHDPCKEIEACESYDCTALERPETSRERACAPAGKLLRAAVANATRATLVMRAAPSALLRNPVLRCQNHCSELSSYGCCEAFWRESRRVSGPGG